ncbi:MAG: hypothetical protein FJX74_13930, partial [Armatimonadetes bacterium]|nr:hypothetical protein [Armatimonadota bacterium]
LAKAPRTKPDGSFSVTVQPPSWTGDWRWHINARLPGYAHARSEPVAPGETPSVTLSRGTTLQGRVVDHAGRPAPNLHVTACWPSYDRRGVYPGVVSYDLTDTAGAFALRQVAPGSYCLWATAETVAPTVKTGVSVPASGAEGVVVQLPAPATLHGRLVYLGSGKPVHGVSVCVTQQDTSVARWAHPDADGRFVIRGLRPGEHTVVLDRPLEYPVMDGDDVVAAKLSEITVGGDRILDGEDLAVGQVSLAAAAGQVIDKTFHIAEGGTVKGVVVTPDGKPAPGAKVYLGWFARDMRARVLPLDHGHSHPLRAHRRILMRATPKGRFCLLGARPGACFVGAESADGRAGHSGYFGLPNLGVHEVKVVLSDRGTLTPPRAPEWVWAKYPPGPRTVLAPAEIRGRVVYLGTRDPVEGVEVALAWVGASDRAGRAVSDAQGRFVLANLPPGKHILRLRKDQPLVVRNGSARWTKEGGWEALSGEVVSDGVRLADAEVEVRLEEGQVLERSFGICEGGIVEGRVLGIDGRPVEGVSVSLWWARKANMPDYTPAEYLAKHPVSFTSRDSAKTDPEGRFRLERVFPGKYWLQARSPERWHALSGLFEVQDRATVSLDVTLTDSMTPLWPVVPQSMKDELWR